MKTQTMGIFEKIAEQEKMLVEEVKSEIQKAIEEGMQSKDPAVQAYWSKTNWQKEAPTTEELILYIANQITLV